MESLKENEGKAMCVIEDQSESCVAQRIYLLPEGEQICSGPQIAHLSIHRQFQYETDYDVGMHKVRGQLQAAVAEIFNLFLV